jgi:soluble lytic murein transglycosylase-like protein
MQSQERITNINNKNKFYLSNKYIPSVQLEITPVIAKQLSYYDNDVRLERNISKQADNTYRGGYIAPATSYVQSNSLKGALPSHEYIDDVFEISHEYNIDPLLLHAIAEVESHFNPNAISPAGAKGLMQIMPSTARRFGMNDPETGLFNPRDNLRICSNYLRSLHSLFGNNIPLILAAYNAGENAVIKYGYTIPPYLETQRYVKKVMNRYLELKDLTYKL